MSDDTALTLAFLSHAPQSAAQVLEEIDPPQAAAFLEDIPARIAGPAVGSMSSFSAARCLELLSVEHAAAILQNTHFHDSTGLVRLIGGERRRAVIDALPTRLGRRLRSALMYPAGSVGAWIDPEIPAFAESATVADATRYLAGASVASHIFLQAADDGRFTGAVPATALLKGQPARRLSELERQPLKPLSSRATLASVAFLHAWDEFLMLPVVGRQRTLVGGLSRASLRKGLQEHHAVREMVPGTLTGHILSAFATSCTGLLRAAAGAQPGKRHNA